MGWNDYGNYTANPGDIVANIPVTTLNQLICLDFTSEPTDSVNVFGYMFLTGNELTPFGFNALIESKIAVYNRSLLRFSNQDLAGSFQFYRTKGAAGPVSVSIFLLDPD